MKKGVNQWVFPASLSLREIFQVTRKYGFDGIEMCPDEDGEISLNQPLSRWKEIASVAETSGVEVRSLACGLWLRRFWRSFRW